MGYFQKGTQLRSLQSPRRQRWLPKNNTDIFDHIECALEPYFKARIKIYLCNDTLVTKTVYDTLVNDKFTKCEMNVNIIKLCMCPVTYRYCREEAEKVFCEIDSLTANNNKYDLLKNRNTFYKEYFNLDSLPLSENLFKFSMKLKCASAMPPSTPSFIHLEDNFYLNLIDFAEFEILSTFPESGKQYKTEELADTKKEILKYFIRNEKMLVYDEMQLNVTFSIYDMQWILPRYQKKIELSAEDSKKLLEGTPISIEVNLKELMAKEMEEIFIDKKFPRMDKGDLLFYEINVVNIYPRRLEFFAFRGDINKFK